MYYTHVITNNNGVSEQVMSFDVFGARRDAQSWALKHTEASSGLLSRALTLRWAPRFCSPAMLLATALAFRGKGVRWGEDTQSSPVSSSLYRP
jgi:hypothetical protein